MARVGIGLPVHNGERYLTQAIQSLVSQTFEDFELVICDNASSDATASIAKGFAESDPRVNYHRSENMVGAAENFNIAVERTRGEYFKWAADDDVCRPEFLERCVRVLDQSPDVVLCYPRTMILGPDGQELGPYERKLPTDSEHPVTRFEALLSIHRCYEVFGLIRRQTLLETPLMGNYSHGDGVLLSRLALRGRLHEIPEYLFLARQHPQQSMARFKGNYHAYAAWFDPLSSGRRVFPHWRLHWEHLRSIVASPLGWTQRLRCAWHLLRWTSYRRSELWGDVRYHLGGRRG